MIGDAALRLSVAVHQVVVSMQSPAPKAPPPDSVTPGVWGFVVIFLIAVVVILLVIDMTRRIRRVRYRAEIAEKLDAEEAASGASGASGRGERPTPDGSGTDDHRD
jgi:hypothetical protein